MRLFHFSDDPSIQAFVPRPVSIPSERPPGRDWLNGPLVWAIEAHRQAMYLFPRDCPRILLWPKADTTAADLERWWGASDCAAIAHIEWAWLERVRTARLYRYELPAEAFEDLDDAGMWVSRTAVRPLDMHALTDLPAALRAQRVELRVVESLTPLKGVWDTSLHASGVRLRNARGW
jgi:hypothetical protein